MTATATDKKNTHCQRKLKDEENTHFAPKSFEMHLLTLILGAVILHQGKCFIIFHYN